MVNNKKVIVCTPAGRRRCLEILANHIKKSPVVDEWHVWVNTLDEQDLEYINRLAEENKELVHLKYVTPDHEMTRDWRQWNLHLFYEYCQEDAVYIRIDDDIVWMEDNAIEALARYRENNTKPFTVYPNILNNCLMAFVQGKLGNIPKELGYPEYTTFNDISLKSGDYFVKMHEQFLQDIKDNNMERYKFDRWVLTENEHHSITVSSFLDMSWRNGKLGENDELQVNVDIPREIGEPNVVYGEPIFIHWQYFYQRQDLESKGLDPDMYLEEYLQLSNI